MTADELLAMLRRHYLPESRPPAGVFAAEIESPCGKRRADALWMPTTWSGERALVGHEIKVTRSDVLAELADPTKADAWAKFCDRWWLVVADPALVDGLDVPESWGIMSPPSGRRTRSMTIVREAPKLTPVDTGPAFRRVAVWLHNRGHDEAAGLKGKAAYLEHQLQLERAHVTRLEQQGLARMDPRAVRVGNILAALDRRAVGYHQDGDVDELIVDAIADHLRLRLAADTVRHELSDLIRAAKKFAEPMAHAAAELERLAQHEAVQR